MKDASTHWLELSGKERAEAALSRAREAWNALSGYRSKCKANLQRYEGSIADGGDFRGYQQRGEVFRGDIALDVTRSHVATIVARVGALQQPKVQFVTSGAKWDTRRKGAKLDQFFDALFTAPTGKYASAHMLRIDCLRDACLFGAGYAIPVPDTESGRLEFERVFPWRLCWVPEDAMDGAPREVWYKRPVSPRQLIARHGKRRPGIREAINNAEKWDVSDDVRSSRSDAAYSGNSGSYVTVWEGWVTANPESLDDEPDGRHVLLISGSNGPVLLVDEEYGLTRQPFATLYWDPPVVGGTGYSLADENAAMEDTLNRMLYRVSDTLDRTSISTVWIPSGSQVKKEDMAETLDARVEEFDGPSPPVTVPVSPVSPAHYQWIAFLKDTMFELRGVSQMASTGERQPGVGSSGAAVRAVQAVQSQRFAWLWRQNEQWLVQLARLAVYGLRTVSEDRDFSVQAANKFLRPLRWSDLDLEDGEFVIQIHPTSESKNTPSDRLERAEELYARGLVSGEAYQAMTSGTLDVQAETERLSIQRQLIESYIERWLDATDDQIQSSWYDEENLIPLLPQPLKFLDLPSALRQVCEAYMQAEADGAPDQIRQLFLQWMRMADAEIQAQENRAAELQGATRGNGDAIGALRQAQQQIPPGAPAEAPAPPPAQ